MRLSVIVPTLGRRTLRRALSTVIREVGPEDQVIVVGDGPQPDARKVIAKLLSVEYYETPATRCWGHAQRNLGMAKATGTHLAFMDDDDVWLPGARRFIAAEVEDHPERLLFFKMKHREGVLWRKPEIEFGNISTQMYVFPNKPGLLPAWRPREESNDGRGGDFLFARDAVERWPVGEVRFCDAVIAQLVGHSEGRVL